MESQALVQNDAVVLGLLALIIGFVFYTQGSSHPFWRALYRFVPGLLLCFFLPSLLTTFGVVDPDRSQIYFVASRYLLPATLVLITMTVDIKGILHLGYKAPLLFFTGALGIVLGGPLAVLLVGTVSPDTVGGDGPEAVWRGLATLAGTWIGGSGNQAALKEVFGVSDELFGQMVAVDVIGTNVWMAFMLYLAARADAIDARTGADTTALGELRRRVEMFREQHARNLTTTDVILVMAVGFGVSGLSHAAGEWLAGWFSASAPGLARFNLTSSFFWVIIIATTVGLFLSATPVKDLEGAGASRIGTGMLYILIAAIGMGMDMSKIFANAGVFVIGAVWISFHGALTFAVARLIKAPLFYAVVASQANIGGVASTPVVASAFHPSLAPVGVALAMLGYAIGTYGGWLTGLLLQAVAG